MTAETLRLPRALPEDVRRERVRVFVTAIVDRILDGAAVRFETDLIADDVQAEDGADLVVVSHRTAIEERSAAVAAICDWLDRAGGPGG